MKLMVKCQNYYPLPWGCKIAVEWNLPEGTLINSTNPRGIKLQWACLSLSSLVTISWQSSKRLQMRWAMNYVFKSKGTWSFSRAQCSGFIRWQVGPRLLPFQLWLLRCFWRVIGLGCISNLAVESEYVEQCGALEDLWEPMGLQTDYLNSSVWRGVLHLKPLHALGHLLQYKHIE